jgi:hypothetical protein
VHQRLGLAWRYDGLELPFEPDAMDVDLVRVGLAATDLGFELGKPPLEHVSSTLPLGQRTPGYIELSLLGQVRTAMPELIGESVGGLQVEDRVGHGATAPHGCTTKSSGTDGSGAFGSSTSGAIVVPASEGPRIGLGGSVVVLVVGPVEVVVAIVVLGTAVDEVVVGGEVVVVGGEVVVGGSSRADRSWRSAGNRNRADRFGAT